MRVPDKVMHDLMQWVVGNRGRRDVNPYGVPEVREALQSIARERGIRSYLDALDNWNPTEADGS